MAHIEPGSVVMIRTADGKELERRAVSGIEDGLDFPVVWVCTEDEWASRNGSLPQGLPWPAEDVEVVREAAVA